MDIQENLKKFQEYLNKKESNSYMKNMAFFLSFFNLSYTENRGEWNCLTECYKCLNENCHNCEKGEGEEDYADEYDCWQHNKEIKISHHINSNYEVFDDGRVVEERGLGWCLYSIKTPKQMVFIKINWEGKKVIKIRVS